MKKTLWGLMVLTAIAVGGYSLNILLPGNLSGHSFLNNHYQNHAWALYGHLGLGGLALMIGPFQFLESLRLKVPSLHRWTGRLYVVLCLLSGISGFVMAVTAEHPTAKYGFIALAIAWIFTTSQAYLKARSRDFTAHKHWMMRSYALTYGAVILRVLLPLQLIAGVPFYYAYLVVSWAAWVPNLLLVEYWIKRRSQGLAYGT